jgi:TolB-like protein/tetratricopeptide (TPR) repeat protein
LAGFVSELRRRKVVRVALAYALVAWLLIQVAETTFDPLRLPDWSVTLVVMLAILGFPLALVVAWMFDVTPQGMRRDAGPGSAEAPERSADPTAGSPAPDTPVPDAVPGPAGDATRSPSVAVLTFADLSPEGDQEYFCRGLAEDISGALAGIPRLRVASRTSASQFRSEGADMAEIGRRLNVATVVEGTVRKAGDRLRVTAQLVNVSDGFQIWGDRYDAELSDVFAVQDRIAGSIADAFELGPDPERQSRDRLQDTTDVEAYDFYLKGTSYLDRTSGHNIGFARDMFRKAVERDPEFTRAWAGLAMAGFMRYLWVDDRDEVMAETDDASERAIALCADSALAQLARGLALTLRKRLDEAAVHLERATQIEPGLYEAWYYYGRVAMQLGQTERAIQLMKQAATIRPTDYQSAMLLPQLYRDLDDEASEAAWSREGLERAHRHLELHPDDYRAMYLAAGALLALDQEAEARTMMDRAVALGGEETGLFYNAACFYARLGELDRAMDWLERSPVGRLPGREWMENDADLAGLRGHPRFLALLEESGPTRSSTAGPAG